MFYKIYNVFDFVEYFCNDLVLFTSYDHLNEICQQLTILEISFTF
jgi:hypothetical protein